MYKTWKGSSSSASISRIGRKVRERKGDRKVDAKGRSM
jgi:hypothetical protein